ncbi:GNAT family N-acetyltransferase [Jatrophihabitans telluris]|uniref:GNAT family N-acetyltransferase n=1 Tax=Jatrophihabitans telluris TaxID=2038343 RepID=A0ABY4R2E0_9ACTN|nr:GNAT family N-acetyltransferase [Jatrophihabitans telluris]UQX89451.1 GNAT family N-acetyltransferase [Jatrophihabitans telluris]
MPESPVSVGIVDQSVTRRLRRDVLRPQLPIEGPLPGDERPDVVHVAALLDGLPVSTCILNPDPCPDRPLAVQPWHLRQMATDPAVRGSGAGRAVIDFALSWLRERDCDVLWCNARTTAAGFYERLGFVVMSAEFIDEDQHRPHVRMLRDL